MIHVHKKILQIFKDAGERWKNDPRKFFVNFFKKRLGEFKKGYSQILVKQTVVLTLWPLSTTIVVFNPFYQLIKSKFDIPDEYKKTTYPQRIARFLSTPHWAHGVVDVNSTSKQRRVPMQWVSSNCDYNIFQK